MRRVDVPLEILYELAMAIGNSTDLEENLQESLSAYLQKLHCFAGAVFEKRHGDDEYPLLVKSIPRESTLTRNEGYRAAMMYPGWSARGLPSKGTAGLDFHYHWFDLPDFGWLLLVRTHQPLSSGLCNALLEINRKLALSAQSCRRAADEQARREAHEREKMLAEVHHRIFNTLSVVSGLLSAQAVQSDDESTVEALRDMRFRIDSMALVYRSLYDSGDYRNVDMSVFCHEAAAHLRKAYPSASRIQIQMEKPCTILPLEQAITCALILTELLGNAFQHAFPDPAEGYVSVSLLRDELQEPAVVTLSVTDNGIEMPGHVTAETEDTLGFYLVRVLTRQLKGSFSLQNGKGEKTLQVQFPL